MRAIFLMCAGLLAGIGSAHGETAQPAAPIDRPFPDYPAAAGTTEGYVKLRFTIAKDGHVADPAIVDSSPLGLFDAAALAGLKQWSYRPRLVDGRPADQPDNTIIIRFKPPAGLVWLNPEPPFYPRQAFDARAEANVTVGFDVTELGTTTNIHILETSAPGIFDTAAIEDVKNRIYRPVVADGHPQGVAAQTTTVEYKLANAMVRPRPTYVVKPEYPPQAHGTGFCALDLTIADDGSVSDVVIEEAYPRGMFDLACRIALKRWKFETREMVGVPVARHLKYLLNFAYGGSETNNRYLKPGQWVVLDYTLMSNGHVKDVKVVDQSEPDLPVDSAIQQLERSSLAPIVENGVAVEKQHLKMKID